MGSNLVDKRSKMILGVNLLTKNDAFRDCKNRNEFRYRRNRYETVHHAYLRKLFNEERRSSGNFVLLYIEVFVDRTLLYHTY